EEMSWIPGHVKHGQFGMSVANARYCFFCRDGYRDPPISVRESPPRRSPHLCEPNAPGVAGWAW
ncbi:hypothetical protein R0K17_24375, partial [Planococcus sp. SIMBA_143]